MSASLELESAILGHTLGYAPMTATTQAFVALCLASAAPTDTLAGIEVSGSGYARMAVLFGASTPSTVATNVQAVEFPTATGNWGTVGYFEIWTAASGGSRLYWGPLVDPADPTAATSETIITGDIMRFSPGALNIQATQLQGTSIGGDFLPISGGTLTGPLTLAGTPITAARHATTKEYVDGFLSLATGTTTPRSAQDRFAEVINVKDFGAVADGTTDDAAAIQAAIDYAATFTPPRNVYAPSGIYVVGTLVTLGTLNPGQCLKGDKGGTVFLLGPGNTSNPCMVNLNPGMRGVTIEGITFDGNAANTTLATPMLQVQTWGDEVTVRHCRFRNCNHTAISAPGDQPLSVSLNATAAMGQKVIQFATKPAALKAGAYPGGGGALLDGDMYLTAVTATTATFNRNLPDTLLSGAGIIFSHAFTTSAIAYYGDTVLATTDTTGLAVGMTVTIADNGCFQTYTRIAAIIANVSVTIDRFLLNKLPSGSNIGAAMGHSRLTVEGCHFNNIGQSRMTAGSRSYNTSGVQASGSYQLTLKNFSASWNGKVGVYPGQKTAAAGLPAGVPANTLIRDLVVNAAASNTHTITLASPLTSSVADNVPVPFQIAVGGAGYGIWQSWGAAFAHADSKFLYNRFEHTWTACIYATVARALFLGNHYIQDQMEYRDPNVAPSPFLALGGSVSPRIIGEYGSGATGQGIEAQHLIGAIIAGCEFSCCGVRGIALYSGHSNIINGVIVNNHGQYANVPVTQDFSATAGGTPGGLYLSGTANFGQPGTMANITVSDVIASDTQNKPTQYFGMMTGDAAATFVNYYQGTLIGTGNITAMLDPVLISKVAANVWSVGAKWTQGAGKPTTTQPAGSIWSRNNGGAGTTLYTTHGAGIWNPLVEGDGSLPGEGMVLYQTGVPVSSAGADTAEETLLSFVLPAGTFQAIGDIVHVVAGGTFAASTDSKTLRCRLGGTGGAIVCSPSGVTVSQTLWVFEAWIVKTGASAQSFISLGSTNSLTSGTGALTAVLNDGAPISILLDCQNSTNAVPGSITVQNFLVETLQ